MVNEVVEVIETKRRTIMLAEFKELIEAAEPFISGDVVDETSGTVPLMERLKKAISKAKKVLEV